MSKEGIRPVTDADENATAAPTGTEGPGEPDAGVERLLQGFLKSLVTEQLKAMK